MTSNAICPKKNTHNHLYTLHVHGRFKMTSNFVSANSDHTS